MSERMRDYLVKLSILMTGLGAGATGATVLAPEPPPTEVIWCCDGTDGGCTVVELMTDCPGGSVLHYCEWGQSTEASGSGGQSGWECLETIVAKPEAPAEVTP